jgi:urease accessory protein
VRARSEVNASTLIEVGCDTSGRTLLQRARCEAPLIVRDGGLTDGVRSLLLVNAAAGPLSGDVLSLTVRVDRGASVHVQSVGASMVQPGPRGGQSRMHTNVFVDEGATLVWDLAPTVSVVGSDHHSVTMITAAATATVHFSESIWLGRHDEPSGHLSVRQRVVVGGVAVLDHHSQFGPGLLASSGAHGPLRGFRSTVIVDDLAPTAPSSSVTSSQSWAHFPLSPRCALLTATTSTFADPMERRSPTNWSVEARPIGA